MNKQYFIFFSPQTEDKEKSPSDPLTLSDEHLLIWLALSPSLSGFLHFPECLSTTSREGVGFLCWIVLGWEPKCVQVFIDESRNRTSGSTGGSQRDYSGLIFVTRTHCVLVSSALVSSGLVWSGVLSSLVWSGLIWSGLVWSAPLLTLVHRPAGATPDHLLEEIIWKKHTWYIQIIRKVRVKSGLIPHASWTETHRSWSSWSLPVRQKERTEGRKQTSIRTPQKWNTFIFCYFPDETWTFSMCAKYGIDLVSASPQRLHLFMDKRLAK